MDSSPAKARLLLVILALEVVLTAGLSVGYRRLLPRRFRTIREGVLYGAGQPEALQWDVLKYKNIRTVINLRVPQEDNAIFQRGKEICRRAGVEHVSIVFGMYVPNERQLERFLRITRQRPPVLVHCHHGRSRTGQMAAAYRIVVQGWSAEEAFNEWVRYGGSGDKRRPLTWEMLAHLERHRRQWRARTQPQPSAAQTPSP